MLGTLPITNLQLPSQAFAGAVRTHHGSQNSPVESRNQWRTKVMDLHSYHGSAYEQDLKGT